MVSVELEQFWKSKFREMKSVRDGAISKKIGTLFDKKIQ